MITKEIYEKTYPKQSAPADAIIVGAAGKPTGKTSSKTSRPKSGTVPAGRSSGTSSGQRTASLRRPNAADKSQAAAVRSKYYKAKQDKQRKKLKILMLVVILLLGLAMLRSCFLTVDGDIDIENLDYPSYVQQKMIPVDGHSRRGKEMSKVNDIVIHYVANPGSSAMDNRNYFASAQSRVSAHFIVGLEGEVIQCVPLNEMSSASNQRNGDTISIEVCHPDSSGRFNDQTYGALVQLTAWLCNEFHLSEGDNLIRHYDITGKNCPKYFVDHPSAWTQFKKDVGRYR